MALSGQIGTVTVEAVEAVEADNGPVEAETLTGYGNRNGTAGAVPTDRAVGTAGAVGTGSVLARMRALGPDRPCPDGVAVFHSAYLAVLEQSRHQSRPQPRHQSRPAVPEQSAPVPTPPPPPLETRLAERYFAALDAVRRGHRPPASWRPLFQYRRHPGVRPLQFALAGINAHIGYDLALAVVDACHGLGCEPADVEGEFERVGDRLLALEERIVEDLAPGPDLLQVTDPLAHLLGTWNLERARDAAWSAARVLWGLRELPDLAAEFGRRTDAGVGLVGHCLLTPWR